MIPVTRSIKNNGLNALPQSFHGNLRPKLSGGIDIAARFSEASGRLVICCCITQRMTPCIINNLGIKVLQALVNAEPGTLTRARYLPPDTHMAAPQGTSSIICHPGMLPVLPA